MDENILRKVVEEVVNKAVEPINQRLGGIEERLDDPETGLKRTNERLKSVWEQTTQLSEDMTEVKDSLGKIELVNQQTSQNVTKLSKRVKTLEDNVGISAPPELTLAEVS